MKIWGMSTEEFTAILEESFAAIKKESREAEARHYAQTRILAANLESALERLRGTTLASDAPQEMPMCA